MLYSFRYKNKQRYNFKEKKAVIFAWEKSDSLLNIDTLKYKNWRGNLLWKNNNWDKSAFMSWQVYNHYLSSNKLRERYYMDWAYKTQGIYKKRPFFINLNDRNDFFKKIAICLNKKDNLEFIKNSIYTLYERTTSFTKILDILNFYWLYSYKNEKQAILQKEKLINVGLKSFFMGFLKKGLKRQCERRFFDLVTLLKQKLNHAGLHIMSFFIQKLWPIVGFRRQRIKRNAGKKKSISFFYKLNRHNLRWKGLLFRRFCLNSPFYQRKAQFVSVTEIYNALIQAVHSRGPIVKCLNVYYRLIKKKTPNDKNKKKKKGR